MLWSPPRCAGAFSPVNELSLARWPDLVGSDSGLGVVDRELHGFRELMVPDM